MPAPSSPPSSVSSPSPSSFRIVPPRWSMPVALGGAALLIVLGILQALVGDSSRPLVGALVFAAVIVVLVVPVHLMQRSGRGIAAPMGTPESRWSMVAFAGINAVGAGAGAVWAAGAGHTAFAVALGAWVVFSLIGLVGAVVGPAESMRGLRPGERPRPRPEAGA